MGIYTEREEMSKHVRGYGEGLRRTKSKTALLCRPGSIARHPLPVVESLQQEGPHARPSASGDGVAEHEALQAVAVVRLAVENVKDLLPQSLSLRHKR